MHKRVRFLSPPSKTHITSTEDAFFIRWGSHDSEMLGDLYGVNQNKGKNWTYSSELQKTYLTIIISHCHFIIIVCLYVISCFSCVQLFAALWTVAHQVPPFKGSSRQEYWSGLSFPSPGDIPNLGIEPGSPALQADPLWSEPPENPQGGNRGLEFLRKRKGQTSFFPFYIP